MRVVVLASVLLAIGAACAASAQDTRIYRCTDASGAITLQNDRPCAKGSRQEIRRLQALPTQPAAASAPTTPAPATSAPSAGDFELVRGPIDAQPPALAPAPIARKPPPALFQCTTWEDAPYLSENGAPEAECVPLATVGIGGNAGLGNGSACEMRQDRCVAIPPAQLCQAWRRRVDEAQFRWRFARSDASDPRKLEYDRLATLLGESACN